MKILGTGLSGLVGSRVVELLKNKYEFEDLSLSSGVDITDQENVIKKVKNSKAPVLLHFAAKTGVDNCEKDKDEDIKILRDKDIKRFLGLKTAWAINVLGTKNIVKACQLAKKKLIYISTDFVFDGEKSQEFNGYGEEDNPNPINWYGQTKYEGENIVRSSNLPWTIVRIAYPYRAYFTKNDFVRTFVERLKEGEKLMMVTDHIMTPTFIDDIAKALDVLIAQGLRGIFHVVGDQFVTPYEASLLITRVFELDESQISKTTRADYFKNKAPRPFYLGLRNDKIEKLGVKMRTFEEGLEEIKRQNSKFR